MIQRDKLLHLAVGVIAGALVCLVGGPFWAAPVAGLVLGIGKEVWDARNPPHVADRWDAVATVVGSFLGGLAVLVVSVRW